MHSDIERADRLLSLDQAIDHWFALCPERVALNMPGFSLSYGGLGTASREARSQLGDLGVKPGDVVAFQLPNWVESVVLFHAVVAHGAVAVPLLPGLRNHELDAMLEECAARLFITTPTWRGFNHEALARRCCARNVAIAMVDPYALRRGVPLLRAAGTGERQPKSATSAIPTMPSGRAGLDAVCSMIFTSGTSGRPKAVLYTHRNLAAEGRSLAQVEGLDGDARLLVPPSIAHVSGISFMLSLPAAVGCGVFMLPEWNADVALETIEREGISWTAGPTPFLQGVVTAAERRPETVSGLRVFRCGGASVPPGLIRRARELGIDAYRSYGLSEHPTVSGRTGQPDTLCADADGIIHPDIEVCVVNPDDPHQKLPQGSTGEIALRGPDQSLGYLRPADNAGARINGWLLTGDIGRVDTQGAIHISGRKKDIIIRKGENIAAKEIEDIVAENPAVLDVAVIGTPDNDRGEMVCCVVVPRPGFALGLTDITGPLRLAGLASYKLPERLVCLEGLPYNAGGKVLKQVLKKMVEAPVITR